MPQYKGFADALTPMLRMQELDLRDKRYVQEQEAERQRQLERDKVAAEELKRRLERQKLEAAVKILTTTGSTDELGAGILKQGGFGGLVQDSKESQTPTQGPWGTAQLDTGGQGRQFTLKRSPQDLEQEWERKSDRVERNEAQALLRAKQMQDLQMPTILAQVMQQHPNASIQEIAPMLVAAGVPAKDIFSMIQQQKNQDRNYSLNKQRTNAYVQRANRPPENITGQRYKQSEKQAELEARLLFEDIEDDMKAAGITDPQAYAQKVVEDYHSGAESMKDMSEETLGKYLEAVLAYRPLMPRK